MAGYSWTFTVSPDTITEVTVTDGVTTATVQATGGGMIVPFFETSAFPETTEVTLSATGYNDVTAVVGTTSSVTFTEAPATPTVAYLSDGTNTYEIEDSQARADIQEIQGNYVTTDTAQTISGEKKFTSDPILDCRNIIWQSATTKGTAPASTEYTAIDFVESGNADGTASHRLGNIEFYVQANGETRAVLRAYQNTADSSANAAIYVVKNSDGTNETYAPAVTNTNGIVTQTALTKATNGCLKLGNGIIVQWGDHNTTSAGASTITFPTAFTDNNYSIVVTRVSGTSATNESGSYYFRGRTTTSVGVYKTNNNTQAMMWIAVGY